MNQKIKRFGFGIISVCATILIVTLLLHNQQDIYAKTLNKIDAITLEINSNINKMISSRDVKSFSSSPYTIVEGNQSYKDLVSLGVPAIKPLYDKINQSKHSGLLEYIYAMAIEEIMSQNYILQLDVDEEKINELQKNGYSLRDVEYSWATAKEFEQAFSDFMKELPKKYEDIKNDSTLNVEKKTFKVTELGLGVIPYLIQDIQNDLNSSLDYENLLMEILVERNQMKDLSEKSKNFVVDDWIKQNYEEYNLLKMIAE
ncbi:MAG: hypothetical protein WDA12_04340 [Bacilli bacterium]